MNKLRLYDISIHTNFHQNRFINEYARKKKAKISESQSHEVFYWDIEELTSLKISKCCIPNQLST